MEKTTRPGAEDTAQPAGNTQGRPEGSATPRKWQRVLRAFADGKKLNRFEAARELRDWCLPSTVAELQGRGITILRKEETVAGHFGPVRCCRYWLAPQSLQRAREVLGLPDPGRAAGDAYNALGASA